MAACAKKADYSGTTVVGKVTAADGNKVTVAIGTLDESADNTAKPGSDGTGDSQTPPDMSGGSSVTFTESGDTAEIDLSAATVTENGNTVSDNAVITVEEDCVWNLTGNCTVTSVTNNGTINFNGYTITLADGTVLK